MRVSPYPAQALTDPRQAAIVYGRNTGKSICGLFWRVHHEIDPDLSADGQRRSGEAEVAPHHPLLRYLFAGSFPSRRATNHAGGAVVGAYQVTGVPDAGREELFFHTKERAQLTLPLD